MGIPRANFRSSYTLGSVSLLRSGSSWIELMGAGDYSSIVGDIGFESDRDCYSQGLEYRLQNYR
jgi:hypothetical protein